MWFLIWYSVSVACLSGLCYLLGVMGLFGGGWFCDEVFINLIV